MEKFFFKINLFFEKNSLPKILLHSILPELLKEKRKRSETKAKIKKNVFSLIVTAKDKTALKASVNSYLKSVLLVLKIIEKEEKLCLKYSKK